MKILHIFFRFLCLLILINFLFCSGLSAQTEVNGKGIVGKWRVVDLKTDEDKKIVEIWEKDGVYFAKIIKITRVYKHTYNFR